MLKKIRLKNFKAFKEDTIIDFTKKNFKILKETNISGDIVKGGIFVGANASGKTSVIKAIQRLLKILFADGKIGAIEDFCLFSNDKLMVTEYEFFINNQTISYNISYDFDKKILKEKLYIDNNLLLNRLGSTGESQITENKNFDELDNDLLLLREIYFNTKFRGHETLREWFEFLENSIYIDAYEQQIYSPKATELHLNEYLEKQGVEKINRFFTKANFEQDIEYDNTSKGNLIKFSMDDDKGIFFKRKGIGEPIPYHLESLGNKKLLILIPSFFYSVENKGMLIIDEFSSGFHNKLEELLVKYFMRNSKDSQLFLVSHSTNLLSNSIFRPDQIYITEFDEKGSHIKRASDEQPREAQNIEKMYLGGVFGGIPKYENV